MSVSEIVSIISVCIGFGSLAVAFIFSFRKDKRTSNDAENEHIRFMQRIDDGVKRIDNSIGDVKEQLTQIDKSINDINRKLVEHDQRIKHLEKEVFKK